MSARSLPLQGGLPQPQRPALELIKRGVAPVSPAALRTAFWIFGILLASAEAWITRYQLSADSIAYLDVSDAVMPGFSWQRLINPVWSPLYPILLGMFRRTFHISPSHEIVASHLLNIAFFIFAFACFEFLLAAILRAVESGDASSPLPLPRWVVLPVAYSLFLWDSVGEISLSRLRPDMLMSGLVYLAAGMLLAMRHAPARWKNYAALGVILGLGVLAKTPMLPIGILMLATSLLVVEDWRPALKMAVAGLAAMLLIGALYFVPLSLQMGRFTMGEAGAYNYIIHVNQASPAWYLQSTGRAKGSFLHPPEKIFTDPPAYGFALPSPITHPLRFDPSYWTAGLRPRFILGAQLHAISLNLYILRRLQRGLVAVVGAVFLLAFLCNGRRQITAAVFKAWPVWFVGLAGCLLFSMVHLEGRYVGAFLALFWLGLLMGFPLPAEFARRIAVLIVVSCCAVSLYPVVRDAYSKYSQPAPANTDAQAAQALVALGLKPGDAVARISPLVSDFGAERILRAQIIAEVDYAYAREFWSSSAATQAELLRTFASRGAKAVIATSPALTRDNESEWTRLGSTQYWVWRPQSR